MIGTTSAGTTQYTDAGLEGSRHYYYRINTLGASGVGVAEAFTRAGAVDFLQYVKVKRETAAGDYDWCYKADLWGHHCEGYYGISLNFFGPDGHLYVSSFRTHSVLKYHGETGDFLGAFSLKSP